MLGTMLKIDKLTSIHSRGHFAQICVEIDLDKHAWAYHQTQIQRIALHMLSMWPLWVGINRLNVLPIWEFRRLKIWLLRSMQAVQQ